MSKDTDGMGAADLHAEDLLALVCIEKGYEAFSQKGDQRRSSVIRLKGTEGVHAEERSSA